LGVMGALLDVMIRPATLQITQEFSVQLLNSMNSKELGGL
jgi:hypothetical protein